MSVLDQLLGQGAGLLAGATGRGKAAPLSIVLFHRVVPEPDPLFPGEMDATRFDRLVGILARAFRIVTIEQALKLHADRTLPHNALAITFDDGYADNAEVALPILQRHGVPASFFVASGFLDGGRMWNDSVIECIRATSYDDVDAGAFGLGRLPLRSSEERRRAIDALLMVFKYFPLQQRDERFPELWRLLGTPRLPEDLMMSSDQLRKLHAGGMEIGGHTVQHPILRVLPDDEAEREIAAGRKSLERVIDAPVSVFAYPNGKPDVDYDRRHVDIVRRLGFKAAVSTSPGVANLGGDLHELPRFTPWDRHPARWMARLLHQRFNTGSAARALLTAPQSVAAATGRPSA